MLASLLACACAAASAQARAPLILAFAELSPWMTREGTAFTGAYTEIMRDLARRLGRRLSIVDCPLKRCLAMLEAGTADVAIGFRNSAERAGYLHFLHTPYRYIVADRVFWVRRGKADLILRYEDLRPLRIGVVAGSAYFARFDADVALHKDVARSNEINLRKLLLDRVDTVLIPEDQALVLIRKMQLQGRVDAAKFREPDPAPRSIAVARASAAAMALLPQMEAAMQAMRRDGTLAALYDQHYYRRFGVTRQQIKVD